MPLRVQPAANCSLIRNLHKPWARRHKAMEMTTPAGLFGTRACSRAGAERRSSFVPESPSKSASVRRCFPCRGEEPSRGHNRIVATVFRSENDVSDFADDVSSELLTSAPIISSARKPGASSSMPMSGLAPFSARWPCTAPRCTFGSREAICFSASSSSLSPKLPIEGAKTSSRILATRRWQSSCRP